jgi:hypothetical protein
MVKYSEANNKLKGMVGKTYSFDLLSGWSCPYAKACLSKAHEVDGSRKIVDGPDTEFRCFSASQEVLFPNVYRLRKRNFDAMRLAASQSPFHVADILDEHLPRKVNRVRIHVGGDFFNQNYFMGWLWLAVRNPHVVFYAYTKSLNLWLKNREIIPDNFVLTASYGGRLDHLIEPNQLRYSKVVMSEAEAEELGLEIDVDDNCAADPSRRDIPFALLIHGTQPAGSEAGKAVRKLKGKGSYGKRKVKV